MKAFFNGSILTMDDQYKVAEVLIEEQGKIVFVGDEKGAKLFLENNSIAVEWMDLQGTTLMPAFIDAHSHLSDTAQLIQTADLRSAKCFDDIKEILQTFIADHPEHQNFIIGLSYDHTVLAEKKHPTKECLDQVSKDIPIAIVHTNLHMCCVNSPLLKIMNITEHTPEPEDGIIGRIAHSNEPNGYLEESPSFPIRGFLKKYYPLTKETLIAAQELYVKNGILTIQDGAVNEELVKMYAKLSEEKIFSTDIIAFPCFNFGEGIGNSIIRYPAFVNAYRNRFKIGGYKLLLDGSPQGKTAWLSVPYEGEEHYCGYPWLNNEAVEAYIQQAFSDNLQLLTHCNGDAASEQLLDAYEKVVATIDTATEKITHSLRPVMIHCQTVRKDQLKRMKKLNMIASIFVDHVYYWGDVHRKNLGDARANQISPVRSAIQEGLIYTFHNDSPVILPSALHSVWSACNRLTKDGIALGKEECIDVYQALKAVTINAAYSYFEENEKGSLEVGKRADLIILDANPLTVHKMQLKNINVLQCIKDGQVIFTK